MKFVRLNGWTNLTALVLLMIAALYTAWVEAGVFLFRLEGDRAISRAAGQGTLQPTISSFSKEIMLRDCLESMQGFQALLQSADDKKTHFEGCRTYAEHIGETHPTLSSAWFVAAEASARLGETDAVNRFLKLAYDGAPHEDWQSKRRVAVILADAAHQSEQNLEILTSDTHTILNSDNGASWMAVVYQRNPKFRDLISEQLELSPERSKRAFLNALKKEVR